MGVKMNQATFITYGEELLDSSFGLLPTKVLVLKKCKQRMGSLKRSSYVMTGLTDPSCSGCASLWTCSKKNQTTVKYNNALNN